MKDLSFLKIIVIFVCALVLVAPFHLKKERKVIAMTVLNQGTTDERKEMLYMKDDEMFLCLIFSDATMKCKTLGKVRAKD